jgi:glycine cleavage system H protein
MAEFPNELKYLASHEWVRVAEDGTATVGISDHAQEALGDVVYVELPDVGRELEAGGEAAVVESVKAASDVYAPVSGAVIEVNQTLDDAPEKVNESPYGEGWFFRIQISNPAELDRLLDATAYQAVCEEE